MDILLEYILKTFDRSTKVIDFHYPEDLLEGFNWMLDEKPNTLEDILLTCRTTLKYAVKTGRKIHEISFGRREPEYNVKYKVDF